MARTVTEIKKQMTDMFIGDTNIQSYYNLDTSKTFEQEFSLVSIESIFFYIVAFCMYVHESLFDTLKSDVNAAIATMLPHTLRWYASKAKSYQHGYDLIADSDKYDNTDLTDDQVAAAQVVKYAAVVELEEATGRQYLRIKLAGESGDDLSALGADQMTGITEYFARIKDAGVKLLITSGEPDSIRQTWDIYYDPLILGSNGSRLDGTDSEPIQTAIKTYLKNLPFNGIYVPQYHTDVVQAVEGMVIAELRSCTTQYGNLPFVSVGTKYTPDAGYLRFDSDGDLVLNFIAQSAIK